MRRARSRKRATTRADSFGGEASTCVACVLGKDVRGLAYISMLVLNAIGLSTVSPKAFQRIGRCHEWIGADHNQSPEHT